MAMTVKTDFMSTTEEAVPPKDEAVSEENECGESKSA